MQKLTLQNGNVVIGSICVKPLSAVWKRIGESQTASSNLIAASQTSIQLKLGYFDVPGSVAAETLFMKTLA